MINAISADINKILIKGSAVKIPIASIPANGSKTIDPCRKIIK
jgi:hypothetical protein